MMNDPPSRLLIHFPPPNHPLRLLQANFKHTIPPINVLSLTMIKIQGREGRGGVMECRACTKPALALHTLNGNTRPCKAISLIGKEMRRTQQAHIFQVGGEVVRFAYIREVCSGCSSGTILQSWKK